MKCKQRPLIKFNINNIVISIKYLVKQPLALKWNYDKILQANTKSELMNWTCIQTGLSKTCIKV